MGEYVVNRPDEGAMEAALRENFAYRQDVARLLGAGVSQCRPLLRRMLEDGEIIRVRQRYLLNDKKT